MNRHLSFRRVFGATTLALFMCGACSGNDSSTCTDGAACLGSTDSGVADVTTGADSTLPTPVPDASTTTDADDESADAIPPRGDAADAEGGAPGAPTWTWARGIPGSTRLTAMGRTGNVELLGDGAANYNFGAGYVVPSNANWYFAELDPKGDPLGVAGYFQSTPVALSLAASASDQFILVGYSIVDGFGNLIPYPCKPTQDTQVSSTHFATVFEPGTPAMGNSCAWGTWTTRAQMQPPPPLPEGGWRAVAVDAQGDIYLAGFEWGTLSGDTASHPLFLTKLTSAGALVWTIAPPQGYGGLTADSIAVDAAGNAYVLAFESSGFGFDLLKYDPSGKLLWHDPLGGMAWYMPSISFDPPLGGVALDGAGNLTIAIDVEGSLGTGMPDAGGIDAGYPPALVVASFDGSGTYRWGHVFAIAQDPNQTLTVTQPRLAPGANGHVVLGGTYWSTIDLGGGPLPSTGMDKGDRNVFLADFDAQGNLLWADGFGKPHTNTLGMLAGNGTGEVVAIGAFTNEIAFGATTLDAPDAQASRYSFAAVGTFP